MKQELITKTVITAAAKMATRQQLANRLALTRAAARKESGGRMDIALLITLWKIAGESDGIVQMELETRLHSGENFTAPDALVFARIGIAGIGIIAEYAYNPHTRLGKWQCCVSQGNYATNAASGGKWFGREMPDGKLPEQVQAILAAELPPPDYC